jgi:hypothetical protein
MITHVVLMKFRAENKETNMAHAHDLLLSMVGKIPELRHLEVGLNCVESERAFDLALVTRFDDIDDLSAYGAHPVHVEVKMFLHRVLEASHLVDYESA